MKFFWVRKLVKNVRSWIAEQVPGGGDLKVSCPYCSKPSLVPSPGKFKCCCCELFFTVKEQQE